MEETVGATVSRRNFLKMSAFVGGVAGIAGATSLTAPAAEEAFAASYYDDIYEEFNIDREKFKRYDEVYNAFAIKNGIGPKAIEGFPLPEPLNEDYVRQLTSDDFEIPFEIGSPGFTGLDIALANSASAVEQLTGSMLSRNGADVCEVKEDGRLVPISLLGQTTESFPAMNPAADAFGVSEEKWEFETPAEASAAVKKAAKLFGADLVGICRYDENFVYGTERWTPTNRADYKPLKEEWDYFKPVEFDFEPKSVIVMAMEMDYEAMSMPATNISRAGARISYSRMPFVSLTLAQFLRKLGYNTFHAGNNRSPSVPEAIMAGLGEPSRMSILVTEEFGPRVRLMKVFTDLECEYDRPKKFGVREFCDVCQVCAEACPTQALSYLPYGDPGNKPASTCEQDIGPGKWYTDAQACLSNWYESVPGNGGCSICIAVCPYNKLKTWNHDLVKVITRVPGLNSLARYFDHFFGFGNIPDDEEIAGFWKA